MYMYILYHITLYYIILYYIYYIISYHIILYISYIYHTYIIHISYIYHTYIYIYIPSFMGCILLAARSQTNWDAHMPYLHPMVPKCVNPQVVHHGFFV